MHTLHPPVQQWSMLKKIGMLFLSFYCLFLFLDFTTRDETVPHIVYIMSKPYASLWDWVIPWTGSHILYIEYPITVKPNGSGDTTYNYVMQLLWIGLALLIAIIIAILDRKTSAYNRLYYWVRIVTRYYLAYVLFTYGFVKIIKLQFPFPDLYQLTQSYGNSSPMGLAWSFIGYSKGYNIFLGCLEVLAGISLCFRRTALLGSLIALTIMTNVAAMNMAYDIPVKIFSFNLIFLAGFLVAHDLDRLKRFFILNIPVSAAGLPMPAKRRRKMILQQSLKGLFLVFALYNTLWTALSAMRKYGDEAPRPPLYGIYNVEKFAKQGTQLLPLTTDTERWKQMIINYPGSVRITTMADSQQYLLLKIDTLKRTALFTSYDDSTNFFLLAYSEPDKDHLLFTGNISSDKVQIFMKRFDLNQFRLVNRGFHWINEYPYNW